MRFQGYHRLYILGCFRHSALTITLPASQASLATVRRLIRRDTFRYLSNLILILLVERGLSRFGTAPIIIYITVSETITDYAFTISFNALPALNFGDLEAGITISFPVCGFLPVLSARSATSKVPNPTNWIFPPAFNSSVTTSMNAFNAFSESFWKFLPFLPLLRLILFCS